MTDFQSLESRLATDLVNALGARTPPTQPRMAVALAVPPADTTMIPDLIALIDALPYFGDPAWNSAFRGTLANLAAANLPNNSISAEPNYTGGFYNAFYQYDGPYSGYRDAFFNGVSQTAAAGDALSQMQAINSGLNAGWWGQYATALLTDAVRSKIAVSVDTAGLSANLVACHSSILTSLSAAFLAVIRSGYAATSLAYRNLTQSGQTASALQQLTDSVKSSAFIANSNEAMSIGGDSTNAATWFLYNNWILLKLLGGNVDQVIRDAASAGLSVPPQIGAGVWWNGGSSGYTQWFTALSGADVAGLTGSRMTDSMPEQEMSTTISLGGGLSLPVTTHTSTVAGYSHSLVEWGSLAKFKPPSSSCLGAGTGILMADLSSKPIEKIVVGDMVWTVDGPQQVALVESPYRAGRTLTSIDGLDLFVTAGHPMRCYGEDGPRYASVEAWTLRDATPTMTEAGVVELAPDVQLLAVTRGAPHPYTVNTLVAHQAGPDDGERVYDLLLKNWETKKPAYFAGGPDIFIGVEAESSNPLREPHATTVLLTALQEAVEASRNHLTEPHRTLGGLINRLDTGNSHRRALLAGWNHDGTQKIERPPIPGPEFYQIDGEWEPHASLLEGHLLRRYARAWRRLLATGWRFQGNEPAANSHLTILLSDVELIGEVPVRLDDEITVAFTLLDYSLNFDRTMVAVAHPPAARRWHPRFDTTVNCGTVRLSADAMLLVTCASGGTPIARCVIPMVGGQIGDQPREFLMSDPDGRITARIAFDIRWLGLNARRAEATLRPEWDPQRMKAMSVIFGAEIGRTFAGTLQDMARAQS